MLFRSALVSGFVRTEVAPLAMNLAMSEGSALPVTPAQWRSDTRRRSEAINSTDDRSAVVEVLPHDRRGFGSVHPQLTTC